MLPVSSVATSSPSESPTKSGALVPWYNKGLDESYEQQTPPKKLNHSFNFELAGASTPLGANNSIVFLSPMKKLSNLHLNAATDDNTKLAEDDDSDYGLGNKTIHESSSSDGEYSQNSPPVFVGSRKRKRAIESPMILTPTITSNDSKDSQLKDMSSICYSNASISKISFSNSESTPCPIPRKKLKFKKLKSADVETPSQSSKQKHKLLDLSNCIKTTQVTSDFHEDDDSMNRSILNLSVVSSPVNEFSGQTTHNQQSTPISQSTPANSRPPTPKLEEYGEEINGYKFVKPPSHSQFNYQTPPNRYGPSRQAKLSLASNDYEKTFNTIKSNISIKQNSKYEIVGQFPVTSAGLMDESDDDLHIADKRINDPYLNDVLTEENPSFSSIKLEYQESTKLPLLQTFNVESPEKEHLLELINDQKSVLMFYNHIVKNSEVKEFVRKDRIRWHPDKWINKVDGVIDKEVVDSLSQVLNNIVESYSE